MSTALEIVRIYLTVSITFSLSLATVMIWRVEAAKEAE